MNLEKLFSAAVPATGDDTNLLLWVVVGIAALVAVLVVVLVLLRRTKGPGLGGPPGAAPEDPGTPRPDPPQPGPTPPEASPPAAAKDLPTDHAVDGPPVVANAPSPGDAVAKAPAPAPASPLEDAPPPVARQQFPAFEAGAPDRQPNPQASEPAAPTGPPADSAAPQKAAPPRVRQRPAPNTPVSSADSPSADDVLKLLDSFNPKS